MKVVADGCFTLKFCNSGNIFFPPHFCGKSEGGQNDRLYWSTGLSGLLTRPERLQSPLMVITYIEKVMVCFENSGMG